VREFQRAPVHVYILNTRLIFLMRMSHDKMDQENWIAAAHLGEFVGVRESNKTCHANALYWNSDNGLWSMHYGSHGFFIEVHSRIHIDSLKDAPAIKLRPSTERRALLFVDHQLVGDGHQ
jgi:hypothetical protein